MCFQIGKNRCILHRIYVVRYYENLGEGVSHIKLYSSILHLLSRGNVIIIIIKGLLHHYVERESSTDLVIETSTKR